LGINNQIAPGDIEFYHQNYSILISRLVF